MNARVWQSASTSPLKRRAWKLPYLWKCLEHLCFQVGKLSAWIQASAHLHMKTVASCVQTAEEFITSEGANLTFLLASLWVWLHTSAVVACSYGVVLLWFCMWPGFWYKYPGLGSSADSAVTMHKQLHYLLHCWQ